VPLNSGLGGPQNPPLSSPYLLHSLHCSGCTQIIKLMSVCDFGLTKKRKCICFVANTAIVPAPCGCCYVIEPQFLHHVAAMLLSHSSCTTWLLCYWATVPAPCDCCCVIALQIVMDSPFVLKVLKGE